MLPVLFRRFGGGGIFRFFFVSVNTHRQKRISAVFTNKEGVFVLSHRTPVASFRALATPARTHARTHTHRRRPSDDERRGAWSAGVAGWMMCLLQDRGIRSARSPLRRPPLFASLSPRPCKAAAPKGGPAFCFDLACPSPLLSSSSSSCCCFCTRTFHIMTAEAPHNHQPSSRGFEHGRRSSEFDDSCVGVWDRRVWRCVPCSGCCVTTRSAGGGARRMRSSVRSRAK